MPNPLFFADTMYAYTPQMNNETTTTVAPKEKYHSDAIYVMYALFIGLALCFCVVFSVRVYIYCRNLCHEYGICEKPCCCCKSKAPIAPLYIVESIPVSNIDLGNMQLFYDDYELDSSHN